MPKDKKPDFDATVVPSSNQKTLDDSVPPIQKTVLMEPLSEKEARRLMGDDTERGQKTEARPPLTLDDTERGVKTTMRAPLADDTERGQKTEMRPPLSEQAAKPKRPSVPSSRGVPGPLEDPGPRGPGTFILPAGYMPPPPKPKVIDKPTGMKLGILAGATLLIGGSLWFVLSPKPPPPVKMPKASKALDDAIKPAFVPKENVEVAPLPEKETRLMIEDKVDGRTVKVEGATLKIESVPEVTISRNGVELGKTPLLTTLPVGTVTLQVANKAEGLARTVTIEVDKKPDQYKKLEFYRGRIDVRAPAGTKIFLDGRQMSSGALSAWPGSHTIDVTFPKGDKDSRKIDVIAGDTVSVEFEAPIHDSALSE